MPSAVGDEAVSRKQILDMMVDKDTLERQLKALLEVLQTHGVGMDEPLVDDEDFPRNDIDVYEIRFTRNQIIRIRNDLKGLMERIEKSMLAYFVQSNLNESSPKINGHSSMKPEH